MPDGTSGRTAPLGFNPDQITGESKLIGYFPCTMVTRTMTTKRTEPGTAGSLYTRLQQDPVLWERCQGMFKEKDWPAHTTLLREGETARHMYFVTKGCLRLWFNKAGKDITFQFFLEGQAVSSMESFLAKTPSAFSLESIEPTSTATIMREDWDRLLELDPRLKDGMLHVVIQRMGSYAQLFLSRIKDSPRERYEALVRERPDLISRIPQRYLASYLGITPVSLSRIRGRIGRQQ